MTPIPRIHRILAISIERPIRSLTSLVLLMAISYAVSDWLAAGRLEVAVLPSSAITLVSSPLPPTNANLGVKYVGKQSCIECHPSQYAGYLLTSHSRAAQKTDVVTEPAAGSFRHPHTGELYQAIHRGSELVHREIRYDTDGKVSGETEVPIAYSIGSGTHGKSYVYRKDGFWNQSPISWFQDTGHWGMSPSYERPIHLSFSRKLDDRCFFCHVGSIDRKAMNPFQFEIVEATIGCERCHGPGELHVKKHQTRSAATVVARSDITIANPASLSRDLSEAICQQCHLTGVAESAVAGTDQWSYRPGLPLTAFRVDYQFRVGNDSMNVVGHVEQMHQSKCYQQTETLTCITCHDPHHTPKAENKIDFYRSVCLKCHAEEACGKTQIERVEIANNDCAECHMPRAATDVPHVAFRHHRIGVHTEPSDKTPEVIAGLSPMLVLSDLTELEQQRCEALAKVQLIRTRDARPEFEKYGREATETLIKLKNLGTEDADVNAALAWLADLQGQQDIAKRLAQQTRATEPAAKHSRIEATRILARAAFRNQDTPQAVSLYRELVTYERDPNDMYSLGLAENNAGNIERGIAALNKSIEIDPSQEASHFALQAIYNSLGNKTEAESHYQAGMENRAKADVLLEKAAKLAR